ncbi:hypothetical protein [Paenibacillus sp. KR2-11]|uniref:hypothetical protein n=1 Tax=Paenibacillus sp. KR2-11 TaxID=3385500 RepID=UPI0038FD3E28
MNGSGSRANSRPDKLLWSWIPGDPDGYEFLLTDPRPDLAKDSRQWTRLIRGAIKLPNPDKALELSLRLWTIRSIGTVIQWNHNGCRLEPILLHEDSEWPSKEFYDEMKVKYLLPYADEIRTLLLKATEQG